MAEALGLASSIVALVQISASVYSATSKFYRDAREAKSNISALATQTRNLSGVLQSLSLLASSPLFHDAGIPIPDFRDTYIESCRTTLHKIKRRLEKAEDDFENGSHRKVITRSLKWPFASEETKDLVAELSQHRDTLQLALSAETMSHLLQCLASTNNIAKSVDSLSRKLDRKASIDTRAGVTAKREEIVHFFLKVNPEHYLQDCRSRRQPNTGRWLVERDQIFRDWMNSLGSQIWLSGIPGAGKTILCATVVEEILQEQTPSTAVAFFFCDYKSTESQKPVNILAALAVQIAKQADAAFELLESYHEKLHPHNRIVRPPETKDMIKVVQRMIDEYERVYLVIDGIDECGSNVVEVLQSLKQLAESSQVNMALFSRKEPDIIEELSDSLRVEIAANTEDLELYVLSQMESRKKLGSLALKNPELHEHIRRTLIEGANGMFRWVSCQLDHLDSLPSDGRRRKALTELPPTLFETYDRILDRIMQEDEFDQRICRRALLWISLEDKTINVSALCEGLSIPNDEDVIDIEHLVDPDWVSRSCGSLIRLSHQESGHPYFQFAHFTVNEYLRSITPHSTRSFFRCSYEQAIRDLFRASLRFLTFPIFDQNPRIAASEIQRMVERNEQHPFYPMAAACIFCFRGQYREEFLTENLSSLLEDETMMQYAKILFSPAKTGMFLSWTLQSIWSWPGVTHNEEDFFNIIGLLLAPEFSPLHVAAMLALPSICEHLIESALVDVNVCCRLGTPLHALLAGLFLLYPGDRFQYNPERHYRNFQFHRQGREKYDLPQRCLKILLENGADTSLMWNGTTIFEMAMNNSIRNFDDKLWPLPLMTDRTLVNEADIKQFTHDIVKEGIERPILDAIVTLGSDMGIGPGWARLASLIQARQMLGKDPSKGSDPPLCIQTRISDEDFADGVRHSIVQNLTHNLKGFLQDPRFKPDMSISMDKYDPMPVLHFAISSVSFKAVELLLEAGCDPKTVDERDGWTSLHQCAVSDTDGAVMTTLLLKVGAVDSVKDESGFTCWHTAAEEGNVPVLKAFIEMGNDTKQSLSTTSSRGRTPLASAIHEGQLESAQLLLDHCSAKLEYFQSDQSLLDGAATIGSRDLFVRLHDKLKEADATEVIHSSKPLRHINISCSPELVEYVLVSWPASRDGDAYAFTQFLLHVSDHLFQDPGVYPPHADMDRIIRALLPPKHVFVDEKTQTHWHSWEVFCGDILPNFTNVCDHQVSQCRAGLIGMIFDILISTEMLVSYERDAHLPAFKMLFQALLNRRDHLKCAWIAPSVNKVIQVQSLPEDLASEKVSIELLSHAVRESNIDLVRELLRHGVDVHVAQGSLSPLEQACYSSDLQMFNIIFGHSDKTLIKRAGSHGKTLLHWAVSGNHPEYLEKIEKLLQFGVGLEIADPNGDTALTLATRISRLDVVALLVSWGANSLHRADDGWTVLHAAADTGDPRYIQHLIPSKTPVSFWLGVCERYVPTLQTEVKNFTAVHIAASSGRSRFLEHLIHMHIPFDVNATTGHPKLTPLHFASTYGHIEVVEILLSSKANVNSRDVFGKRAIDMAAMNQHSTIFMKLLKSGSERPSGRPGKLIARLMSKETESVEGTGDSEAMSQFYFENAIMQGDLHRCGELVSKGQSINSKLLTHSYTPLVCAVIEGQSDIVDWLVSRGVEIPTPTFGRLHPLLRGIISLSIHRIPSLQTLGAVLSLALQQNVSWYGDSSSPLHVAILDNKVEALRVVLEHIRKNECAYRKIIDAERTLVPADFIDRRRRSAVSILANEFNHDVALSNGSPWKQAFPLGQPLHWAIRKNSIDAAKLLLQHEADLNQVDSLGKTPLVLAVSSSHPAKLLRELLQAGAGLEEPSRCRNEAMQSAILTGDLEVVKILAEAAPETLKWVDQFSADDVIYAAGSADVFQYLVSQGSDPFKVTETRKAAITFHMASRSLLSPFIFNSGLISHASEESIVFPFAFAAGNNELWVIKSLYRTLSRDLFATIVNSMKYGTASALCLAALNNEAKLATALISMGAEIESEGSLYGSPLMLASYWGCLDVVRCLVRSGAVLSYVNKDGLLRSAVNLSSGHQKITRWLLVERHTEQRKLEYQPLRCNSQQAVWSGPRLFKLALPAYMHRNFGESRWSHLRRLQNWKKGLLGSALAESRRNSGLDFKAELEVDSRKNVAQAARHQFLARLGEE